LPSKLVKLISIWKYLRYLKGSIPKNPAPTIGVEFATKNVVLRQGGTVKAQIWDTGM